jgi:hypothetical protein
VTIALWLVPSGAVMAAKLADLEPAAMVTEAGNVSAALELESVTEEPPAGAAWFNVTMQVLTELRRKLEGAQVIADGMTGAPTPVMTPPVGTITMPLPEADEPTVLFRLMEVADVPAAIVKSTNATVPFPIIVVFIP